MARRKTPLKEMTPEQLAAHYARIGKKISRSLKRRQKRIARERRREKYLREHPFYSEITGKRYKTEANMLKYEGQYIQKWGLDEPDVDFSEEEILFGEIMNSNNFPIIWNNLRTVGTQTAASHRDDTVVRRLGYEFQSGDFNAFSSESVQAYADTYGIDAPDVDGVTLLQWLLYVARFDREASSPYGGN